MLPNRLGFDSGTCQQRVLNCAIVHPGTTDLTHTDTDARRECGYFPPVYFGIAHNCTVAYCNGKVPKWVPTPAPSSATVARDGGDGSGTATGAGAGSCLAGAGAGAGAGTAPHMAIAAPETGSDLSQAKSPERQQHTAHRVVTDAEHAAA